MEQTKMAIQVKNLRKVYKVGNERVVALDRISFDIPAGQICCIVGTSGSGKSTLLNQLAGLEKPTKGQVMVAGRPISSLSENELARFRQRNIGFIFQSYNLLPSITALENVCLPLIFRGISKVRREKAGKRILREVGLGGRMRHRPSQMSGGQQQRVGIARAFVASPKIVFADEPTGNLDTATTAEVMRMMVRLVREHKQTLILVTHEPELSQFADRTIAIVDGNIVRDELNPHPLTDEELALPPEPAETDKEDAAPKTQANEDAEEEVDTAESPPDSALEETPEQEEKGMDDEKE